MEGKEFLKHGDLTKLAKKLNVTRDHLIKVANGQLKSQRLTFALEQLARQRKKEISEVLETIN